MRHFAAFNLCKAMSISDIQFTGEVGEAGEFTGEVGDTGGEGPD